MYNEQKIIKDIIDAIVENGLTVGEARDILFKVDDEIGKQKVILDNGMIDRINASTRVPCATSAKNTAYPSVTY